MTITDLSGTTGIVTGGGRGLGRSMVHALAAAGANVTAAMHISDDIEEETKDLPGKVSAIVADIRDPVTCTQIVADTISKFGGVDVLINNAGVGMLLVSETFNRTPTKFWDVNTDAWTQIIETNVNGGFQMAREAVPHMLKKGWGRIVNVTTSIHTMQRAGFSPYGPSKAAMEASTSCWSEDLEGTGVTCNILIPGGAADTNLLPGNPGDEGRSGADGMLVDPVVMRAPIVWLASKESDGWNGKRFIGRLWDEDLPADAAAVACSAPAGFADRA
ncbi:MAG: (S)-1-Phenylethanol dehydrogenase [Alphaproteobacteria bacterium MarineAlpha11_Bin1]|nr:MAG: (S)-1-Phenylethanol dehydrogenase [Alphaproteobacteria bacterium MarineAlpha11_Bin1]